MKFILDWSKPLPQTQHKNPSEESIKDSLEIRKGFTKGQTLLDYFKIKSS